MPVPTGSPFAQTFQLVVSVVPAGGGGQYQLPLQGVDQGNGTAVIATSETPVLGATARVTAGGLAPGQSIKNYSGTVTLNGSGTQVVTLETVTTGKTYLLTDIILTTNDTGPDFVQITVAGTPVVNAYINSTKGLEMMGIETQPQGSAGQAVALVVPAGTAGKIIAYNVYGIEQ